MKKMFSFLVPFICVSEILNASQSILSNAEITTNQVRIINEGTTALNQILELIEGAQVSLDLEYFLFRADLAGKIITQALIKKAKAGVQIRILLDHNTAMVEITDIYARRLIDRGIEVKYFSRTIPFSSKDLLWRNHRKLIVADDSRAMFGGRNVGNEYFDQNNKYNFIDRDIYVEGPLVRSVANSFDQYWNAKDSMLPHVEWYYRERYNGLSRLKSWIAEVDKFFVEDKAVIARVELHKVIGGPLLRLSPFFECNDSIFVSDSPQIPKRPYVNELFLELLKRTQQDLVTETPYFILKHEGYDLLIKFLENRGHFVMLTNGLYSTDIGLVQAAFMERITEPLKKGAEIHVYGGSVPNYPMISSIAEKAVWGIHSKTVVFDKKHTLIGTFNLDPRSTNFNHELAFVCRNNPTLAAFVTGDIQLRMNFAGQLGVNGKPLDNRYPYFEASPFVKAGIWVFSPLIQYFDEFL